ncbi:FAD-dependent oxidoreductase [Serinibacter arcticus]|uniref:FAD-dependent oxidoreductase n=1 Tax=Serinibacter arcticus TaxID=1655435 RepID=UPI001F24DD0B|nr:FAD/NAD(P)-binding oxidoreductase [Serinibacter arcticus]
MSTTTHHDVVIVGGGNAGLSLAGRLHRDGARDVVVVEPEDVHHYRPMLSYVAGGQASLTQLRRPQDEVTPDGVGRVRGRVVRVDADRRLVHLESGGTLHYNDLALCPGSSVDWDAVPGSADAVATGHAATSYLPDSAVRTWEMLAGLTAGRAVFVMDDRHVPCAPVALKPLFLALAHWRATGVREAIDVELLVAGPRLVDLARADSVLHDAAIAQGVRVRYGVVVSGVEAAGRTLTLRDADPTGTASTTNHAPVPYDALYLAPPHRAPDWIATSGLAVEPDGSDGGGPDAGFLLVDPGTLQHPDHPRIWGLGDVAALDALPSGARCASRSRWWRRTSPRAVGARPTSPTTATRSPRWSPGRATSCSPSSTGRARSSRPCPSWTWSAPVR